MNSCIQTIIMFCPVDLERICDIKKKKEKEKKERKKRKETKTKQKRDILFSLKDFEMSKT